MEHEQKKKETKENKAKDKHKGKTEGKDKKREKTNDSGTSSKDSTTRHKEKKKVVKFNFTSFKVNKIFKLIKTLMICF